jgi:predicted amidohydrolase YtcJ
VLPGFNDAHAHLLSVGIEPIETDLSDAASREEVLNRLGDAAAERPPGRWVVGHNYDESGWENERMLSKGELDRVSQEHPVAAFQVAGHAVSVNKMGLDSLDLRQVKRDVQTENGTETGILVEDAAGLVKQRTFPRGERARKALQLAGERALSLGITSVQHVSGLTAPADHGSPIQRAFFDAWEADELPVRITFYVHSEKAKSLADLEIATGFGDAMLRIGGLKTFSDGALGARTAKRSEPYLDEPENTGTWTTTPEDLECLFEIAADAGQQIATHAIGDRAIKVVLSAYESCLEGYETDPRLRIEHLELTTDEQLERLADANIVASMQPNFLQWAGEGGVYERVLGLDARGQNNRFADVVNAEIPLAFGSDTMPMDPLWGIHNAVNAPHESQRLSVDDALVAYTRGSAYAEHSEDVKGTLEKGKLGDAVVLDADPYANPEQINDINVAMTILGGEIKFERT